MLLAADVRDPLHAHHLEQASLVRPTGALFQPVSSAERACGEVADAFRLARLERRPVVLSVPIEVQRQAWPGAAVPAPAAPVRQQPQPEPAAVRVAAEVLAAAGRPVIVAGRGAVLAGAWESLERLAETAGALLATTTEANGYFAGGAYDLGHERHPEVAHVQQLGRVEEAGGRPGVAATSYSNVWASRSAAPTRTATPPPRMRVADRLVVLSQPACQWKSSKTRDIASVDGSRCWW